jgi:hypothetical protein
VNSYFVFLFVSVEERKTRTEILQSTINYKKVKDDLPIVTVRLKECEERKVLRGELVRWIAFSANLGFEEYRIGNRGTSMRTI